MLSRCQAGSPTNAAVWRGHEGDDRSGRVAWCRNNDKRDGRRRCHDCAESPDTGHPQSHTRDSRNRGRKRALYVCSNPRPRSRKYCGGMWNAVIWAPNPDRALHMDTPIGGGPPGPDRTSPGGTVAPRLTAPRAAARSQQESMKNGPLAWARKQEYLVPLHRHVPPRQQRSRNPPATRRW